MNDEEFIFDYGIIEYKHRFTIKRGLDDYVVTRIDRCINLSLSEKCNYNNERWFEIHCIYKDSNNKLQFLRLTLNDYTVKVIYKGNMLINI